MKRIKDKKQRRSVSYAKWGYIFIAPFFIIYATCSLLPLLSTFYNSFFENYRDGLKQIGPNFVGLANYVQLFTPNASGSVDILKYAWNTFYIWILGSIPQIVVAMLLAVWFTSYRLNIKGQGFFKSVIYMPNLIMASAFAMLFFTLFSNVGPVNQLLVQTGLADAPVDFFGKVITVRALIAMMNFLMWFGNTTIVLMAGIMGIDQSLFDAAQMDGAKSLQVFFRVTVPLLMPILVYVVVTAMIGGIQMFDVPQVLTNRLGTPDRTAMTLIMYLNSYLTPSKNFGMGGAISTVIFLLTASLSFVVYKNLIKQYKPEERKISRTARRAQKFAQKACREREEAAQL
ncbi:MAG: sugar ABC transporter permease [Oscillospiraceae bacterium]|nr:sugar ABC transporter permease [Oscillospiraceae bacterium]